MKESAALDIISLRSGRGVKWVGMGNFSKG